jgi:hypothetical protein
MTEIFGPLVNAFSQALRPVGDVFERMLHAIDAIDDEDDRR